MNTVMARRIVIVKEIRSPEKKNEQQRKSEFLTLHFPLVKQKIGFILETIFKRRLKQSNRLPLVWTIRSRIVTARCSELSAVLQQVSLAAFKLIQTSVVKTTCNLIATKNEKGTGDEIRAAVVSGIVTEDALVS